MALTTVGILSPGDMGHAVGQVLGSHTLRVITCLRGRSERTKSLARRANIADVESYEQLVRQADIILSILVPAQAEHAARTVAQAISDANANVTYADCNAIAPQTVLRIGDLITDAGGHFVDASIIGSPPKAGRRTVFYASGLDIRGFQDLSQFGLEVVVLGDQIGLASAMKMCYAALTKGLIAICTELLTAAEALGISEHLHREFRTSQMELYERMEGGLPRMPMKSRRWVGEMEQIAQTFQGVGLTPAIYRGAADIYRFVGETELADLTPEDPIPAIQLTEVISTLAGHLPEGSD
jgi:3-hydroxyisobutyrate dehydrogenase-like beta-hydroxyacid dehydrogenase